MATRAYVLKARNFGSLQGTKIYYTKFAERPKFLPEKGTGFGGLKHLLEVLGKKFKKFKLVITSEDKCSLKKRGKLTTVTLSAKVVRSIFGKKIDRSRDILTRIAKEILHDNFPNKFDAPKYLAYRKGMFAELFSEGFDYSQLGPADRAALTKYVGSDKAAVTDIKEAYKKSRSVQLVYLDQLIREYESALEKNNNENWWQKYFSKRILFFQDSYIRVIEKLNVAIGITKYPDFMVVSSDGYLDIIELKTPQTELLKLDPSRKNYFWGTEVNKAISQVENYIDKITKNSDAIRTTLKDDEGFDFQIVRPRGIIVVGRSSDFSTTQKKANDFRLLSNGLKNVEILPFDELGQRLRNTRKSMADLSEAMRNRPPKGKK